MKNFDTAFTRLLGNEDGYVNNPKDPGGATNWGITEKVARANGYTGDMRALPQSKAKDIYEKLYWAPVKADQMPFAIAFQVFDAAVNMGVAAASRCLQRAVGVKDDGIIGPATLKAVSGMPIAKVLLRFNAARERYYTSLGGWNTFGKGWSNRVAGNLDYAADDL